jgi:uncharacterized heparinase superfamily protein
MLIGGRGGRGVFARLRGPPRRRRREKAAEELLLAPPILRTADASFLSEFAADNFGLAGSVAVLRGRSPFQIEPPNLEWERELHGFGWLHHLDVARSADVEAAARDLVREWIATSKRGARPAWAPEVVARRVISWMAHAALLLDGADKRPYGSIMRSLDEQVRFLSGAWRDAPDGYPRLLALIALVSADLCIAERDAQLAHSLPLLSAELRRQILPDGSHIDRNPATLIELILELLPLRQCFAARGLAPDPALIDAIGRLAPMLRTLMLGDGLVTRFNGVGFIGRDALATALAYDAKPALGPSGSKPSGYVRLERGATIVIADMGSPPPLEMSGTACAGCLAFEMSVGPDLLLANAGRPMAYDLRLRALARGTASHNTLCLNEQSSSTLVRNPRLEQRIGAVPIQHPDAVTCEVSEDMGGITVEATHDGYAARFKVNHTRRLSLDATGTILEGIDTLSSIKGDQRFAWDLPFAIHFRLHPDAEASIGQAPEMVDLALDTGEHWRMSVSGAAISIEDGLYFADVGGTQPCQQIVLRAVCGGAAEVHWCLERIRQGRSLDPRVKQRLRAERRQAVV